MNGSERRITYDSIIDDSLDLIKNDYNPNYQQSISTHSFDILSNGRTALSSDPLIFYTQPKKRNKKCCSCETCFGKSYDILAVVISILDVSTDIIVCIEFYQKDRMIFFGISIAILMLALLAYDLAFVFRFSREYYPAPQICLMICLLPFSPCLPFVFYFTDSRDRHLSIFIENNCCFDIEMEDPLIPDDASKLRRFMEAKIAKHLGFILEALVEAFPQAILQMTAVVLYNEAAYIPIISILISLLSVASKSFVFSIAISLTFKQLIFNWLCAITDFFSIFVAVCWVFYEPKSDHLSHAFDIIAFVWFAKLIFLLFPLIIFLSFVLHIVATYEFTNANRPHDGIGETISRAIIGFILVTLAWICGIIVSALSLEVLNWTWLAGTLFHLGTQRFPSNKTSSEFYFTLLGWINSATKHRVGGIYNGYTSFTRHEDKMMRLCSVNYMTMKNLGYERDYKWEKYLSLNRDNGQYMNVTYSNLRSHTLDINKSQFCNKFYKWYGEIWRGEYKYAKELCDSLDVWSCYNFKRCCKQSLIAWVFWMVTFVFGPIYFVSRFCTLLFPIWIIIYLYFSYDVIIWNTQYLDLFQVVIITIYLGLCLIVLLLFYWNCREQYLMAHILPFTNSLPSVNYEHTVKETIKKITNHYYEIVVIPIRKALIFEFFGYDLGAIVLAYLPLNDHYEGTDKNVVRVKAVV
eukprot:226341_1